MTLTLPGDFDASGVVEAADYVVWRKMNGTPAGYNLWRSHFGVPPGSGSELVGASPAQAAVPEAATLVYADVRDNWMVPPHDAGPHRKSRQLINSVRLVNNPPILNQVFNYG